MTGLGRPLGENILVPALFFRRVMADIFEIVGVNAEVKVKDKSYPLQDPQMSKKIAFMKELDALNKIRDSLSGTEAMEKDWQMQKKYVQLYLPDLTDKEIDTMGQHTFQVLSDALTEVAKDKFGACVKKIESEKKPLAATN